MDGTPALLLLLWVLFSSLGSDAPLDVAGSSPQWPTTPLPCQPPGRPGLLWHPYTSAAARLQSQTRGAAVGAGEGPLQAGRVIFCVPPLQLGLVASQPAVPSAAAAPRRTNQPASQPALPPAALKGHPRPVTHRRSARGPSSRAALEPPGSRQGLLLAGSTGGRGRGRRRGRGRGSLALTRLASGALPPSLFKLKPPQAGSRRPAPVAQLGLALCLSTPSREAEAQPACAERLRGGAGPGACALLLSR